MPSRRGSVDAYRDRRASRCRRIISLGPTTARSNTYRPAAMMPMTGWPTANITSATANRITLATRRSLTVRGALRQKVAMLWTNLLTLYRESHKTSTEAPGRSLLPKRGPRDEHSPPAEGGHVSTATSHRMTGGSCEEFAAVHRRVSPTNAGRTPASQSLHRWLDRRGIHGGYVAHCVYGCHDCDGETGPRCDSRRDPRAARSRRRRSITPAPRRHSPCDRATTGCG